MRTCTTAYQTCRNSPTAEQPPTWESFSHIWVSVALEGSNYTSGNPTFSRKSQQDWQTASEWLTRLKEKRHMRSVCIKSLLGSRLLLNYSRMFDVHQATSWEEIIISTKDVTILDFWIHFCWNWASLNRQTFTALMCRCWETVLIIFIFTICTSSK